MNKVVLVGRITKDPELRKTPNGASVVNFSIAVNRTFTNGDGEREADFVNCVCWGKPAENMSIYVSKGALLGVDGRIQTRNYEDANNQRVYVTEVVAESVQFLDTKKKGQVSQSQSNNQGDDILNSSDILNGLDVSDDDLPF